MELTAAYPALSGSLPIGPFEGDLTLELAALPVGALITASTLTLSPAAAIPGGTFAEELLLGDATGGFGATTSRGSNHVEVDFHTRRGLVAATPVSPPTTPPALQVDVGGLLLDVGSAGQVPAPAGDKGYQLPQDCTLPGLTVSRFRLHGSGVPDLKTVTVRAVPTGLSARVGTLPPFWTRVGELSRPVTTPDWAPVLTAALTDGQVRDGVYVLPLILHSDSLCRLEVSWSIRYVLEATGLPDGIPDVFQSFDHGSLAKEGQPVASVALPVGAAVIATSGRARGRFDSTRVMLGAVGAVTAPSAATVAGDRAQAQPVQCDQDVPVDAIDLLLATGTEGASLQLQLVDDIDGRPWNTPLLPAPATLTLPGSRDPRPQWATATLDERFRFRAGHRYWVILQALTGSAVWSAEPVPPDSDPAKADPGLQWSGDGGHSWRMTTAPGADPARNGSAPAPDGLPPPLRALLRLRGTPAAFEVPALLSVGAPGRTQFAGARVAAPAPTDVPLDRLRASGRFEVDLDLPELVSALQVAADAAPGPAPAAEYLVNGDFAIWLTVTHQDGEQHQEPEAWQLTSGVVSSLERRNGADLGADGDPSALSQVVAVVPGADYVLAVTTTGAQDAAADVIWRGGDCTGRRTDGLALDPVFLTAGAKSRVPFTYRLRVTSPTGATQAEVRLRTSAVDLTVASVSLRAGEGAVLNGDLREPLTAAGTGADAPRPPGWTVTPAAGGLRLMPTATAVALGNHDAVPITLTQQVPVHVGRFRLEVTAAGLVPGDGVTVPLPTFAVQWLSGGGATRLGPAITFAATSFACHLAEGRVPDGTTAAEVSVVLPANTPLALAWFGLRITQPASVQLPVNVVAQAPGEVRVAGVAVRYDVPAPTPPAFGPAGPCLPTPLDAIPGAPPPATRACSCGRIGTEAAVTTVVRWAVATGPVIPPPAVGTLPVEAVRNVGPARAARLTEAGITTVEALARTPADIVRAILPDLSLMRAERLVASARERLDTGYQVRWVELVAEPTGSRVLAIGGITSPGTAWRLPVRDAADGVVRGLWALYVQDGDTRVPVIIRDGNLRAPCAQGGSDLLTGLPAQPRRVSSQSLSQSTRPRRPVQGHGYSRQNGGHSPGSR